jgi:hypothetical protein
MKPLKTAADLKKYLPDLNVNKSEATINAHIDWAMIKLREIMGNVLYDDLAELWQSQENGGYEMPRNYQILLLLAQPVIAWFAFISMIKSGIVQVGDAGIKETSTDNTSPVRQWVYNTSLESAWEKADSYTEVLLSWIEANANQFPKYAQSEERKLQRSFFIQDIQQFQVWHDIQSSYRLYNILRRQFAAVELQYVQPTMLPYLFQDIKSKLGRGADLKPSEQTAVEYARAVVACFSLRDALPSLNLNIKINGVTVRRSDDGLVKHENPTEGQIKWLTDYLSERGNYWNQMLREHLIKNIDQLPLFRELYQKVSLPVNEHSVGIFYL